MPSIEIPTKSARGLAAAFRKQPPLTRAAVMLGVPAAIVLALVAKRRGGGGSGVAVTGGDIGAATGGDSYIDLSGDLQYLDERITELENSSWGWDQTPSTDPPPATSTPSPTPPLVHDDPVIDPQRPYPMPTTPPPTTKPPITIPGAPSPTPLPSWKPVEIPAYVRRDIATSGPLGDSGQKQLTHALNVATQRGVAVPDWLRAQVASGKVGDDGARHLRGILDTLEGKR